MCSKTSRAGMCWPIFADTDFDLLCFPVRPLSLGRPWHIIIGVIILTYIPFFLSISSPVVELVVLCQRTADAER